MYVYRNQEIQIIVDLDFFYIVHFWLKLNYIAFKKYNFYNLKRDDLNFEFIHKLRYLYLELFQKTLQIIFFKLQQNNKKILWIKNYFTCEYSI